MDEVSNFCTGDVCSLKSAVPRTHLARSSLRDDPSLCKLDCRAYQVCLSAHLHMCTATFRLSYTSILILTIVLSQQGANATMSSLVSPPYDVSNGLARTPLGVKVMSVLAQHLDGSLQYNTHQLYGLSEAMCNYDAAQAIRKKRPFILSR